VGAHFYVDESGNFADAHDEVVAGGVLLSEVVTDVRKQLEAAVPGCPWPLHGAHLNRPIVWALLAHLRDASTGSADSDVRAVIDILRRVDNPGLQQALQRLRQGAWPEVKLLQRLGIALQQERPEVAKRLGNLVRRARAALVRLGRTFVPQASLVISAEGTWTVLDVARSTPRTGDQETDRYYEAMLAAIERARDVARRADQDVVRVTVLTRPVYDPSERRYRSLETADVQSLVQQLPPGSCLVEVHAVARWDPDVPPPCVLADLCTNVSRWVLGDPTVSLLDLEARLHDWTGLAVRSGDPLRSHVASVFPPGPGVWRDPDPAVAAKVAAVGVKQWAWEEVLEQRDAVPR
jgi:AcrR family transcriptional regulator